MSLSFGEDVIDYNTDYIGPFHTESIKLTYNSDTGLYEGDTHIMFPYFSDTNNKYGLFIFDGALTYDKFHDIFKHIDFSAKGINSAIGTTGAFLTSLSASFDYTAPAPPANPCGGKTPCCYMINLNAKPDYIFKGEAHISAGPGIPTGVGETVYPLDMVNNITLLNLTHFSMTGKGLVFGYETGNDGDLEYNEGKLSFTGHVSYGNFYDSVTTMTFNSLDDISGNTKGTLHTPALPVIGKMDLANAEADIDAHGFSGVVNVPAPGIPKQICPDISVPNCWKACVKFLGCHKVCGPDIKVPGPCIPNPAYYTIPVNFQLHDGNFSFSKVSSGHINPMSFEQKRHAVEENGNGLDFMTNWRTVASTSTFRGSQPFSFTPNGEPVTTLTIADGLPSVIFRIAFTNKNTQGVSATLTMPDGQQLQLEDGLEKEFDSVQGFSLWNPEGMDASFFLNAPVGGDYTITINNPADLDDFSVEAIAQNHVPQIEVESIQPAGEPNQFEVRWEDFDPDDNAEIRFYVDTDREDHDGRYIASVEEDDLQNVITLDLNDLDLQPGNYYLMMKINDGINAPVCVYSRQSIHVTNPYTLPPVTGIAVRTGDGQFDISWDPDDAAAALMKYVVVFARMDDPDTFIEAGSVPPGQHSATITGLENGYPILVSVKAVNMEGKSSELVDILRVVTRSTAGRTYPVIISQPETVATVGKQYFYYPQLFDADLHHFMDAVPAEEEEFSDPYTWTLLEGPEGMVIVDGRYLIWTPTEDQMGDQYVAIRISDRYAEEGSDTEIAGSVQEFTVFVQDAPYAVTSSKHPFCFLSYPPLSAMEGQTYAYEPITNAPAGSVHYNLVEKPEGMTISDEGILQWNVPMSAKGAKVLLVATVAEQYEIEQEFFLHAVTAENTLSPSASNIGFELK